MTTNASQLSNGASQCGDLHEHAIEHARVRSLLTKKLRRKQTDMRLKTLSDLELHVGKQLNAPTPAG